MYVTTGQADAGSVAGGKAMILDDVDMELGGQRLESGRQQAATCVGVGVGDGDSVSALGKETSKSEAESTSG